MVRRLVKVGYVTARRIVVCVVGGTLVGFGLVMLITPGPGLLGIAAGLGVLSLEFAWARHWLHKVRDAAEEQRRRLGNGLRNGFGAGSGGAAGTGNEVGRGSDEASGGSRRGGQS